MSEFAEVPIIDCLNAMRDLWDYLDKELPDDRTEQIRNHLATCTGCQAHVEFCRAFLEQITPPPVQPAEVRRMRDRVQLALLRDGLSALT